MDIDLKSSDLVKAAAFSVGAATLNSCGIFSSNPQENMCGYSASKLDKVRVGCIGLGMRGPMAVDRLAKIRDVEIVALCDIEETRVVKAQGLLTKNGRRPAKLFSGAEDSWRGLLELDLDLIYIATPWEWHTPMAVAAMRAGKHAAVEVPAGKTIDELWELVETSEKTGMHCMMLENACYDFFELQTLNMVRQGVFGELTHAEGAYIHNLSELIQAEYYHENWRFYENLNGSGNLYPTHGIGPVAQAMNINRGNQFDYLTSMSSKEAAFTAHARDRGSIRKKYAAVKGYRGDMNNTTIKLKNGQTILVKHDVSTPRPYSRIHLLQGTKGMCRKWPKEAVALVGENGAHNFLNDSRLKELQSEYMHPLSKVMGDVARKIGGHGGMDFIMDYRLIYCLKNGLSLDQDVYDAAAWSSIGPLSVESVENRSKSVDVPDFTRGRWQSNKPLDIVTVDTRRLSLRASLKNNKNPLNIL